MIQQYIKHKRSWLRGALSHHQGPAEALQSCIKQPASGPSAELVQTSACSRWAPCQCGCYSTQCSANATRHATTWMDMLADDAIRVQQSTFVPHLVMSSTSTPVSRPPLMSWLSSLGLNRRSQLGGSTVDRPPAGPGTNTGWDQSTKQTTVLHSSVVGG